MWVIMCWVAAAHIQHIAKRDDFLSCKIFQPADRTRMIDTRKVLGAARQHPRRVCAIMWVIMCWVVAANIQHVAKRDPSEPAHLARVELWLDYMSECTNTLRIGAAS